ncbi:unnamed protein product [Tuber aestivum]|uniref:COX assembly mitochondrial protein n=1 Tax=Tuber aestivum TaxID=59557 RepID=A0A292PTP8_9PEZI|nr:unnamed protein product [Tuber aestivum]
MHPHLNRTNNEGPPPPSPYPMFESETTKQNKTRQDKTHSCAEVTRILEECHARGFVWKAMGMCNGAKHNLNMCLRAERLERTRRNREAATVKRKEIVRVWEDIEANS